METIRYKSHRIIDGKPKRVVVLTNLKRNLKICLENYD